MTELQVSALRHYLGRKGNGPRFRKADTLHGRIKGTQKSIILAQRFSDNLDLISLASLPLEVGY